MLDDDTYLLKHNLAHFLADFNHTESHYFGKGSSFIGCDGNQNSILMDRS